MAFYDHQLAGIMRHLLVYHEVLDEAALDGLLRDPTEIKVLKYVNDDTPNRFKLYWSTLREWMQMKGGDISDTSGRHVPGRIGGEPRGLGAAAIYNDAFKDVSKNIKAIKLGKALSNQLRFINQFASTESDSESDS